MTNTVSKTVSDETLDCIIQIESAGRPAIKASTSSALGLFQFLNATWDGVVKEHRPDLLEGRSRDQVRALRTKPEIAIELGARFTEDNQRAIGMDCSGGDLYLAHFLGVGDARDFYRADPSTPADRLFKPEVIDANRSIFIVNGKMQTAGQIRAWAARKMNEAGAKARKATGGKGWVATYYKPTKAAEPAEPELTADDIPDPQDAPETPLPEPTVVVPVDAPPEVVKKQIEHSIARDAESSPSWLKRKWKAVTGWFGGGLGLGGVGLFDWKILAAITVIAIIIGVVVLWAIGPGNMRAWIRRQVE